MSGTANTKVSADHLLQGGTFNELGDRQSPDWNDKLRTQDLDLIVHPR